MNKPVVALGPSSICPCALAALRFLGADILTQNAHVFADMVEKRKDDLNDRSVWITGDGAGESAQLEH